MIAFKERYCTGECEVDPPISPIFFSSLYLSRVLRSIFRSLVMIIGRNIYIYMHTDKSQFDYYSSEEKDKYVFITTNTFSQKFPTTVKRAISTTSEYMENCC